MCICAHVLKETWYLLIQMEKNVDLKVWWFIKMLFKASGMYCELHFIKISFVTQIGDKTDVLLGQI